MLRNNQTRDLIARSPQDDAAIFLPCEALREAWVNILPYLDSVFIRIVSVVKRFGGLAVGRAFTRRPADKKLTKIGQTPYACFRSLGKGGALSSSLQSY